MAFVAGAAAILGTTYQVDQERKARRKQEAANEKAARIEQLQGQRERKEAIRQQRIRSAQIIAQAANADVQSSSPVQGALGALASQGAENVSFANQIDELNRQRLVNLTRADKYQMRGRRGAALGGVVEAAAPIYKHFNLPTVV